jgi:hypothetical protein
MYISPQQKYRMNNRDKIIKDRKERAIRLKGTLIEPECFKITYYPEGIDPFVSIPKKKS